VASRKCDELTEPRGLRIPWRAVVTAVLFASTAALAQTVPGAPQPVDALTQKLTTKLQEMRDAEGFPGATVGFVLPDGRTFSLATGLADVEAKTPMRASDRMFSGSIGKTYVAALMLKLVEEGKASLDEKISYWLGDKPWFGRLPNAKQITLRSLLNHTSGIPNHAEDKEFFEAVKKDPNDAQTHERLIGYVLDKPPLAPVGTKFAYADTNYILIGLIIEKITGKSYYSVLEQQILQPLHLNDTLSSDQRVMPGVVSGYIDSDNPFGLPAKVCTNGRDVLNPAIEWTGGGLASTAGDLARWGWLLLGGRVLKEASLKEMLTGVEIGPGIKYGLGIGIVDTRLGPAYGHNGEFPGFGSTLMYFPRYRISVAVQVNTDPEGKAKTPGREGAIDLAEIIVEHIQAHK